MGEELVGKNLSLFHTPEQVPSVELANLEVKQTGVFTGEICHVRLDGTVFPTLMHNSLVRDDTGKPIGMMGTLRDISDIKQIEEALLESKEHYRSLVEDQVELVCRVKPNGTFLYANSGFLHFFGKTKGVEEGSNWESVAHPDDLPMIKEQLSRLCPENPIVMIENRVYDAKKEIRWVQFSNRAFFDEKGVIHEIQSVGRDITERKQAEEQRDKLIVELQKALSEVKTLRGILPICSHCKKIRDDKGYWNQIESYIHEHSDAEFSHGICQECAEKYYPGMGLFDEDET